MSLLRHWYYMSRATLWLLLAFARAHWYFRRKALSDLQLPDSEMLTSREKRRLQHYFYGGTFLSVIFAALRGRTRSREEKHRLTNLAALAYYFDDLVDAFRHRDDTGMLWRDNPEEFGLAADDHRRLAQHFLHNLYDSLPASSLNAFKSAMHRVFNVETAGRQQAGEVEQLNELQKVTAEKGGYSVLLFRSILAPLPDQNEEKALLDFGALIQYCDDIFDLWFDHQEGTLTAATILAPKGEISRLSALFEAQVQQTRRSFRAINAPRRRVETALCVVHYITSITRVCLAHYAGLVRAGQPLPLHDRSRVVVDMEQWPNRLRTAFRLILPR